MNSDLTAEDRLTLDAILDILIPSNTMRNIPAAGAAGVGDFIESETQSASCIGDHVNALLGHNELRDGDVTVDKVSQLENDMPEAFSALLRITYMGYYSQPELRALMGVAVWPVHPKGYDVLSEGDALLDELTLPVKTRGPCYRES